MRCFILDDDQSNTDMMYSAVNRRFDEVIVAHTASEFFARYVPLEPAVLLCDYDLPGQNGADVAGQITSNGWPIAIIGVTGHVESEFEVEMRRKGAVEFISKPIKLAHINDALVRAIAIAKEKGEEAKLMATCRDLVMRLTKKQREVLYRRLKGLHLSRKELAHELNIELSSLGCHLDAINKRGVILNDAEEQYFVYRILRTEFDVSA